ncbi:hypothetical protein GW17_00057519 [Ensete ventricosum]|nr:hypothetical protein GW17_00057519 [Ensete ventricosum]RZS29164.1 hypothetical protein BHM03_00062860 [Ensete ventricosum]
MRDVSFVTNSSIARNCVGDTHRTMKFETQAFDQVQVVAEVITGSKRGVLTEPGATQLVRMLSFAHSQARLLVSWFSAAGEEQGEGQVAERSRRARRGIEYAPLVAP